MEWYAYANINILIFVIQQTTFSQFDSFQMQDMSEQLEIIKMIKVNFKFTSK